jgi:hypothetical protein
MHPFFRALAFGAALCVVGCTGSESPDAAPLDVPCGSLCSDPRCAQCYGSCCIAFQDAAVDSALPLDDGGCPPCYPWQMCVNGLCLMRDGGADATPEAASGGDASDAQAGDAATPMDAAADAGG